MRLKNETDDKKKRKIFYKIEDVGENVRMSSKKKFKNLNINGTRDNKIILIGRYRDVMNLKKKSVSLQKLEI